MFIRLEIITQPQKKNFLVWGSEHDYYMFLGSLKSNLMFIFPITSGFSHHLEKSSQPHKNKKQFWPGDQAIFTTLREKIMSPQQNSFVKQILLSILKFGWHYKKNG